MKFRPAVFDGVDLLMLILSIGALALAAALLTVLDVERELETLSESSPSNLPVATEREGPFALDRSRRPEAAYLSSTADAVDAALFEGRIFIATRGGLLAYSPAGEPPAGGGRLTHLNGLPSNRLSCLATWRDGLYAGTDAGLAVLREGYVTTYRPTGGDASITALLPLGGDRLLVGTAGNGLLEFDGSRFSRGVGGLPGAAFRSVTALAEWHGQVVVGSRESGLYIQRGALFIPLGVDSGLPDAHVTSISAADDLLVATVTGVCRVDARGAALPWARPMPASSLLRTSGATLVATLDGRLERYASGRRREQAALGDRGHPVVINRLAYADGRAWVLASSGAYVWSQDGLREFSEKSPRGLRAGHIAALAVDGAGRLWIGYFDAGLQVLTKDLEPYPALDDELSRTVKCLYFDPFDGSIYLGSSKGLLRYRPDGGRDALTVEDGLISNEVNHVCRMGSELVAATGGGVSMIGREGVRSVYAFHGLINNHVFSVAPVGERLYAGTLGGISVLEEHAVVGHLTPENSELPVHWVTALMERDGALLIGTYGGGLALARPDSPLERLSPRGGRRDLEINPNALIGAGGLVLAGSLDGGLVVGRPDGRWEMLRRGLPSANVTALAADELRLFIGTDCGILIIDRDKL